MAKRKQEYLKKLTHIFDEKTREYLPVIDKIAEFKRHSKSASTRSFKLIREEKKKALRRLKTAKTKRRNKPPVPGGVGYGVYFRDNFRLNFSNFAALDFGILVPDLAGGDSQKEIYLTSTNGTAKGVEALIRYVGQDTPDFCIFDWAKPEAARWSLAVAVAGIPQYFSTVTVNGTSHRFCRVLNRTERVSPGRWENKVCLFNFPANQWDKVYEFQYPCPDSAQKHAFQGSWGPIVETFQPTFGDLNPLGFCNTLLYNDANNPVIAPGNSTIRDDADDGVDVMFLHPNDSFFVG